MTRFLRTLSLVGRGRLPKEKKSKKRKKKAISCNRCSRWNNGQRAGRASLTQWYPQMYPIITLPSEFGLIPNGLMLFSFRSQKWARGQLLASPHPASHPSGQDAAKLECHHARLSLLRDINAVILTGIFKTTTRTMWSRGPRSNAAGCPLHECLGRTAYGSLDRSI